MEQKIVVHMKGGAIHKGVTQDFEPSRTTFHILPAEGGGVPVRIQTQEMKAMFWVRDYLGNREFVAHQGFEGTAEGRRAVLIFLDGESMWGMVEDENAQWEGFYFRPADERDNNLRIFVVKNSLKEVRWVS